MFPSSLMSEAIALASSCAERGLAINSAQESFLDNLVSLSHNAVDTSCQASDMDGARVDRCYAFGEVEDGVHAQFSDTAALAVAEVATKNIMVARTDALPLIGEIMEAFEQVINPDIPYAYRRRAVVPVPFHPIWQSEYIVQAGDTYADGANAGQVPPGLVLSTEEEQFNNFLELTKTGLPQVDKLLEDLVSKYEDEQLKNLFRAVFCNGYLEAVRGPQSLTEGWINDQILVYVWARQLADMSPEKSTHNLPSYRAGISTVISRAGANIWNINKVRQNCAEGDILILAYAGDQVFVHSDIYTNWLKKGGSPEIVLGASLLTGQLRPSSCADLTAMAEVLDAKWTDYVSITSRSEQENLNAQARVELFRIVRTRVDQRKQEGLVGIYEDAMATLNEMIGNLPTNFIKDPYPWVRNIVLGTFYTGTEVSLFVMSMDEIENDDDDLSEDEVAFLATVNYVTDWAAGLVVVKSGNL